MKYLILIASLLFLGNTSFAQQQKTKTGPKPAAKTAKVPPPVKRPPKKTRVPDPPPVTSGTDEADRAIEPPMPPVPPTAGSDNRQEIYEATAALEQMPEFKGGMQGLRNYLSSNLEYPVQAQRTDIQGKVVVSFTVCEDGRLCDEKVMRGIGGGCDEEALRVIKKMPKWEPGVKDGKPVKVRYVLPIMFQLQD